MGSARTSPRRLQSLRPKERSPVHRRCGLARGRAAPHGRHGDKALFRRSGEQPEIRDQGAVLSYAVVTFDHGRIHVEGHGPIVPLALKTPAPTPIPTGTASVFGYIFPTKTWQSVNATADFAWSGQAMRAMYRQATGQTVDGVIALDVPALSDLLSVVGPITVAGFAQPVTATNAATVLLSDLYDAFTPDPTSQAVRKNALRDRRSQRQSSADQCV